MWHYMKLRDHILWYPFVLLCALFCLIYPIALIGVTFDVHPPFSLAWAASALLILEGAILILAAMLAYGWVSSLTAVASVMLFSFCVETLGVNTGTPFGNYYYTNALIPPLPGGVPLPVIFAWVLVIFGVYGWCQSLLERIPNGRISVTIALFGALLTTLLDIEIEPVAAHLQHYWHWTDPDPLSYYNIPFTNFAAWYVISLILLLLLQAFLPHISTRKLPTASPPRLALLAPRILFAASLLMFGLVDLSHSYFGASAPGVLAALLLLFISSPHQTRANGAGNLGQRP